MMETSRVDEGRRLRIRGLALVGMGLVFFALSLWWSAGDYDPVGSILFEVVVPAGWVGFTVGAALSWLMWGPMGRGSGVAGVLGGSTAAFGLILLQWQTMGGDTGFGAVVSVIALGSGFMGAVFGTLAFLSVAPKEQTESDGATGVNG